MNFIHTIKFKFTLWYLAILSILLIFLCCGVYFALSKVLYSNFDKSLKNRVFQLEDIRGIISIVSEGTFEGKPGEYVSFYYYTGNQLKNISQHGLTFPLDDQLIDRALAGEHIFATVNFSGNGLYRFYISPFIPDNSKGRHDPLSNPEKDPDWLNRDDKRTRKSPPMPENKREQQIEIDKAALIVASPTKGIENALARLFEILLFAVPLTLILSGAGGMFLAHRAFKPVEQMTHTARRIQESDLSLRIDVETTDELGNLASVLNQMIARLEQAFKRQKEFTSDASHELRAPLAIIQAEATLSLQKIREPSEYRRALEMISVESEQMATLTHQLMELARADSGTEKYPFEIIELTSFIQGISADVSVLCNENNILLTTNCSEKIRVQGDKKRLRRVMLNIFQNAIRFTGKGGSITVQVKDNYEHAVISFSDTGIGIHEDQLSHIFERFYRVDKARSRDEGGSGLGLAICKTIMDTHGGSIEVVSQIRKGSTFFIKLPICRDLS